MQKKIIQEKGKVHIGVIFNFVCAVMRVNLPLVVNVPRAVTNGLPQIINYEDERTVQT